MSKRLCYLQDKGRKETQHAWQDQAACGATCGAGCRRCDGKQRGAVRRMGMRNPKVLDLGALWNRCRSKVPGGVSV